MTTKPCRAAEATLQINAAHNDLLREADRYMLRGRITLWGSTAMVAVSLAVIGHLERSGSTTAAPIVGVCAMIIGDIGEYTAEKLFQKGRSRLNQPSPEKRHIEIHLRSE
jgi:hypothetical protein